MSQKALYRVSTAAILLAMLFGGLTDVLHHPYADRTMAHLGFPPYFQNILGTWKLLAVAALLTPGRPRLKEWATQGSSSMSAAPRSATQCAAIASSSCHPSSC